MFYFSEPGDVARAFECAIQSGGSTLSFWSISITDLFFHSATRSFLRPTPTQGRAKTFENIEGFSIEWKQIQKAFFFIKSCGQALDPGGMHLPNYHFFYGWGSPPYVLSYFWSIEPAFIVCKRNFWNWCSNHQQRRRYEHGSETSHPFMSYDKQIDR